VLNGLTEAWVSLKRIQRLLEVRIACVWLSICMLMNLNLINLQ
jgi:hypothetical protein